MPNANAAHAILARHAADGATAATRLGGVDATMLAAPGGLGDAARVATRGAVGRS